MGIFDDDFDDDFFDDEPFDDEDSDLGAFHPDNKYDDSDDEEVIGPFESFDEFDAFMQDLRSKSLNNLKNRLIADDERMPQLPSLFKINLQSPVEFGLILQSIIYTSRFTN